MTDRESSLPSATSNDDPALAAELAALYARTPAAEPAQIARCTSAVLSAALPAPGAARTIGGLRFRWWWGAAAAALLIAVVTRPWRPDQAQQEADSAFVAAAAALEPRGLTVEERNGSVTRFDLTLPASTKAVSLVGDFNGWDEAATPMVRRASDGAWSTRVPLPPGRHVYAFVVDGQRWLVDPLAPQVPDAGFGPTNALIVGGTP